MIIESKDGDPSIEVPLQEKLIIPADARNPTVSAVRAAVWNTIPNVLDGRNILTINKGGTSIVTVTIDRGSYSVSQLAAAISRGLVLAGEASTLLTITGDDATQKVIFTSDVSDTEIIVTGTSPFEILGLNLGVFLLADAGVSYAAPNRAKFNSVNRFQISTNVVGRGLPVNGQYSGVLTTIPITSSSGFQIIYNPTIPSTVAINDMVGTTLQSITAILTDENGQQVFTGEPWSVEMMIQYDDL